MSRRPAWLTSLVAAPGHGPLPAVLLVLTVTTGIVSQVYANGLIQLNAAVNPGNSGGPVFDMQGRVFGIATAKFRQLGDGQSVDGLAVAIPIHWLDPR